MTTFALTCASDTKIRNSSIVVDFKHICKNIILTAGCSNLIVIKVIKLKVDPLVLLLSKTRTVRYLVIQQREN